MHEFPGMVLTAFDWLTVWGFVSGFTESFLYGSYSGLVFVPIYNFLFLPAGQQNRGRSEFLFE